jgi:hypothetical protein
MNLFFDSICYLYPPLEFCWFDYFDTHSRWASFLLQRYFSHWQNMLRIILSASTSLGTIAKEALP